MNTGRRRQQQSDTPMAEINMVPMIDIMLVLLIVFMITAPLMTHAVKLQLPQTDSQPNKVENKPVFISVDAVGQFFLNNERLEKNALESKIATLAGSVNTPEIQLYADQSVAYSYVAELLGLLSRYGLHKISFVTHPAEK
jgi:Biopolymer transport protein